MCSGFLLLGGLERNTCSFPLSSLFVGFVVTVLLIGITIIFSRSKSLIWQSLTSACVFWFRWSNVESSCGHLNVLKHCSLRLSWNVLIESSFLSESSAQLVPFLMIFVRGDPFLLSVLGSRRRALQTTMFKEIPPSKRMVPLNPVASSIFWVTRGNTRLKEEPISMIPKAIAKCLVKYRLQITTEGSITNAYPTPAIVMEARIVLDYGYAWE